MSASGSLPKKSLGQHWLHDEISLNAMADMGEVSAGDNVLEVGPGLGTLTDILIARGANVVAVEFDEELATNLSEKAQHETNLSIANEDILNFDLGKLNNYKVVANIPYYLTGRLLRKLLEDNNYPDVITLLIQKEVAQRIAEEPGKMSIISVVAQHFCDIELGPEVKAELFTPPPKVDSQIIKLTRRADIIDIDSKKLFRVVKAGFSEKRKKLANSLSGGLHIEKSDIESKLSMLGFGENVRAQELSLKDWYKLTEILND